MKLWTSFNVTLTFPDVDSLTGATPLAERTGLWSQTDLLRIQDGTHSTCDGGQASQPPGASVFSVSKERKAPSYG